MSRALAGALIVAAALVLLGALFLLRSPRRAVDASADEAAARMPDGAAAEPAAPSEAPASVPQEPMESRQVTLWLPGPAGRIAPMTVEVESVPEPKARIEALLGALLAARPTPPLAPLFTTEVKLVSTLRGADATLYVDLAGADGGEPPGSGSELELQRVYSIVHTVVRNEPSVVRVILLWNGAQRLSLAGHVDTGHPLEPRADLELAPKDAL